MNWMYGDGMGAGGWVVMSVGWVVLVLLVVWAASQLLPRRDTLQATGKARFSSPRNADAHTILDRRLARGDIDIDTHEQLRERLGGDSSARGK